MNRRRLFLLALALVATGGIAWVVHGAWFSAPGEPAAALRCLGVKCTGEVVACLGDEECKAWLDCIQECGDDKMKCPTFCGAFYQSPKANAFTQCGLTHQCIQLDFGALPACGAPDVPAVPLENADGTWWVAGIKGPDYVLFDDCQRFVLQTLPNGVSAHNTVPLTRGGQTRICKNDGQYTRTDSGVMQLVYENWVGYRERWHFTHRFENSMLAYVCSASSSEQSHDYGAFILSRVPLAELSTFERTALIGALRDVYHLELGALTPLKVAGCPNP